MANDRIWLRCECNEEILLAKCGTVPGRDWIISPVSMDGPSVRKDSCDNRLDEFLQDHSFCGANEDGTGLSLRYESQGRMKSKHEMGSRKNT